MEYRLSVIIPYFLKWQEFRFVWPQNTDQFQRDDLEVIICLDEPSDEMRVLELVKDAPINLKVLICRETHTWRTPAKAINVGLRHAQGEYAMVVSADCRLSPDAIDNLLHRSGITRAVTGFVRWCQLGSVEPAMPESPLFYGSLCFPMLAAKYIGGYDECFSKWGGDDDDFNARLELANLAIVHEHSVWVDHFEPMSDSFLNRTVGIPNHIPRPTSRICAKCFPNWGRSYDEMILSKQRTKC